MSKLQIGQKALLRLGFIEGHQLVTCFILKKFLCFALVRWSVHDTDSDSHYIVSRWELIWRIIYE